MHASTERKLAAIMIADVAGFSRLMERDESLTFARLRRLREEVNFPKIEEHGGRVIKTTGDGFLAEFGSATAAVKCAIEIQRSVIELEVGQTDADRIRFRIGINVGDIIIDGEDIAGDGVNIAARLEPLSPVDGICISSSVREQIRDDLGVAFEDMGEQQLKNISRPIRAYSVRFGSAFPQQPTAAVSAAPKGSVSKQVRLSIVVLPFTNASGDPGQEYFSDGVTDDVTAQLSKIKGSYVIGRDTAFTYKGKNVDIKSLGVELGARYVLRGSVERFEEGVDTDVQLIDALTGAILWTDSIEVDKAGIRNIRREVANRLAIALNLQLTVAEAKRSQAENPDNPDATDLVMQGWAAFGGAHSLANTIAAQGLFERALLLQADYLPALVGRSNALFSEAFGFPSSNRNELVAKAEADAMRAVALDSLDALAHYALSRVRLIQKRIEAALAECDNALTLDGNLVKAQAWRGFLLICNGQPELAPASIDKALTQSPRDPYRSVWLFWKGLAYYYQDKFPEAIAWSEKSSYWFMFAVLAASYFLIGDLAKANMAKAQLLNLNPNWSVSTLRSLTSFSDNAEFVLRQERVLECLIQLGIPE